MEKSNKAIMIIIRKSMDSSAIEKHIETSFVIRRTAICRIKSEYIYLTSRYQEVSGLHVQTVLQDSKHVHF